MEGSNVRLADFKKYTFLKKKEKEKQQHMIVKYNARKNKIQLEGRGDMW